METFGHGSRAVWRPARSLINHLNVEYWYAMIPIYSGGALIETIRSIIKIAWLNCNVVALVLFLILVYNCLMVTNRIN